MFYAITGVNWRRIENSQPHVNNLSRSGRSVEKKCEQFDSLHLALGRFPEPADGFIQALPSLSLSLQGRGDKNQALREISRFLSGHCLPMFCRCRERAGADVATGIGAGAVISLRRTAWLFEAHQIHQAASE